MASPASVDDQPSPTSLPGRDPIADADTTSARKRQRTTPPDQNETREGSPRQSSGSPQIHIVELEPGTSPTAAIYIMDDPVLGVNDITSFPGVTAHQSPEQAAAALADALMNLKTNLTHPTTKTLIESFAQWFQDFVAAAEVTIDYTSYVQDRWFWHHVGRCFYSLTARRSELHRDQSLLAQAYHRDLLRSFGKLFAILCAIEAEQLERATSRRDSAKPSSPGRCKLLFQVYANAFARLLIQRETISSDSSEHQALCGMAACFVDHQQSNGIFFRTLSLITTRLDEIEQSLPAALCYLQLSHSLCSAVMPPNSSPAYQTRMSERDMDLRRIDLFRGTAINILQLALSKVVPAVSRIHPDAAPAEFHATFTADLVRLVSLLEMEDLPGSLKCTISVVFDFTAMPEDFPVPRPDTNLLNEIAHNVRAPTMLKLDLALSFIKSNIMALRVTGLEHLNDYLLLLWTSSKNPLHVRHLQPHLQLASQYLLAHDIVAYLFGPESHADLIRRSERVIEYLLVTKSLTRAHLDMLFQTLLLNQGSDIGQATYCALQSVVLSADYHQAMYLCQKFATLQAPQLGRVVSQLFWELVQSMTRSAFNATEKFELARKCVQVIQEVSHASEHAELPLLRHHLGKTMSQLFSTADGLAVRHNILRLCAEEVKNKTRFATGSILLLLDLAGDTDTTVRRDVLHFDEIVTELVHFVNTSRDSLDRVESHRLGLRSRVLLALGTCAPTDEVDLVKTEHEFWEHAFESKALNNDARGMAWDCLVMGVHRAPVQRIPVFRKFTSEYLPTLTSAHAPAELYGVAQCSFKLAAHGMSFDFPLRKQMVRFAITSPTDVVADIFMRAITAILFSETALKYPAAAGEQQAEVTADCFRYMRSEDGRDMEKTRAVMLLKLLLTSSIEFEKSCRVQDTSHSETTQSSPSLLPATKASTVLPVVIHGPEGVQHDAIAVDEHDTFDEVQSALSAIAKCEKFTVICAGKYLELDAQPTMKVNESNVSGQTLTVKKVVTLSGIEEERSKRAGRTNIEQAILQRLDDLYNQLASSDALGEKTYDLLVMLQHTTSWRPAALSESRWKVLFSIHTLRLDLRDQISYGIADAEYIRRGVLTLVDALQHFHASADFGLLTHIATTLFEYLIERPNEDYVTQYFINPEQFVDAALAALDHCAGLILRSNATGESEQAIETARSVYRSLLQAVRLSSAVCDALIGARMSFPVHKKILSTAKLAEVIATCVRTFCSDEDGPRRMKQLLWTITLDSMLQETYERGSCFSVFNLGPALLMANPQIWSSEVELCGLVTRLSKELLQAKHEEQLGMDFADERIPGLCTIILFCVCKLKSFGKPLHFGDLALEVFRRFLFPTEQSTTVGSRKAFASIVTQETRHKLYSLILALCEDSRTVEMLVNLTLEETELASIPYWFEYPGADRFNRAKCGYSGLANLQQTCYMNSLIQQLYMNVRFRKFILETSAEKHANQQVLAEFQRAFAAMQESYSLGYCPEGLAKALDVDVTVQDDAQIFFTILIGKLEESMPDEAAKKELQEFFAGVNKSQTVGECGHVSESPDTYFNLSLVVKDKSCLRESLQEYVQGASLNGGDKFKCTTCKSTDGGVYVNASRRTALESIPDNLVLGLKRFQYETYDGGAKVNDIFDFPESIDMSPYKIQHLSDPSQPSEPDLFKLVGVVVHDGTLQYGHYWSYAAERSLSDEDKMLWFRLEDRLVTPVELSDVLSQTRGGLIQPEGNVRPWLRSDNAYVLFYERLSSIKAATTKHSSQISKAVSRPNVVIPAALETDIAAQNELHIRRLNLFADEHASFVLSLLSKAADVNDVAREGDPLVQPLLIQLAMKYLFKVTIRTDTLPQFEGIISTLQRMSQLHWENAANLLSLLFEGPAVDVYARFMFHRNRLVRNSIRQLASGCLKRLQSATGNESCAPPKAYQSWLQKTMDMHALLGKHLHTAEARNSWPEYFLLVADVAALGAREHSAILNRDFLTLALEMLYLSANSTSLEARDKYHDLWEQLQSSRVYPWFSVVECIYSLLKDNINLAMIRRGDDLSDLSRNEVDMITRTNKSGRSLLVLHALASCDGDSEHCGPFKLVALLTNSEKTHADLTHAAVLQLKQGVEFRDEYKEYARAIAYCFEHGNLSGPNKNTLIMAMCQLTRRVDDASDIFLAFMTQIHATLAPMVLETMPAWANRLLACEEVDVEEATNIWLKKMVFNQPPLVPPVNPENLMLDLDRGMAVKSLTAKLMSTLQKACDERAEHDDMERADEAFRNCYTWLGQFVQAVETFSSDSDTQQDVDSDMIAALNEAATDAKSMIDQCEEVFNWLGDWASGVQTSIRYYSSVPMSKRGATASPSYDESPTYTKGSQHANYDDAEYGLYGEEYTDNESEEDDFSDSDLIDGR